MRRKPARQHSRKYPRKLKLCQSSPAVECLECRAMFAISPAPAAIGSQPTGALHGKIVFLSGGHGFFWDGTKWITGRGLTNGIFEDMGNQDQLEFFARYLLAGGATVVSMRPVGHQVNEVIVDNADVYSASTGGFQIVSGTWGGSIRAAVE